MAPNSKKKIISSNRRAKFNYEIIEYLEAGISLKGSEIKSVREGKVNISEGYVQIREAGAWLHNVHIASYQPAGNNNQHNATRPKRLLLHKKEQTRIRLKIDKQKLTVIPTSMYIKGRLAKVEIAVGKGRRKFDKRDLIKKRESDREINRSIKTR